MSAWTYEKYWTAVLGGHCDAARVVSERDLYLLGLSEWLGRAETEAWRAQGYPGDLPEGWAAFHARALDELVRAIDDAVHTPKTDATP
jgi:hypothetical protein